MGEDGSVLVLEEQASGQEDEEEEGEEDEEMDFSEFLKQGGIDLDDEEVDMEDEDIV